MPFNFFLIGFTYFFNIWVPEMTTPRMSQGKKKKINYTIKTQKKLPTYLKSSENILIPWQPKIPSPSLKD